MKKAALHNLGCKVNSYETEAMQQMLEEAGFAIVPFSEKADVYVINTCSVTNVADRKSRQMIHRARKMNPEAAVVAAGCYVQAAAEELKKDESIDIIIGNNKKTELVALLNQWFEEKRRRDEVIDIAETHEYEELHIKKIAEHTRAFIKVQDGCNQFCSYCIIPYTRGRVRSRRLEDILEEITGLVSRGYKEMVLTGIHLSSYGIDFKDEDTGLLKLIQAVNEIEGVERIRLGSLEPRIVTEEFAQALASMPKVCPHFHLSLQSGCDETLKRMNRRYTSEEYFKGCEILRSVYDMPAITTDVIAGFAGETEEEFKTTEAFLKRVHFYEMHVFKYSKRAGTRAAGMPDQVPEHVKTQRSDILLELEKEMSKEYRQSFIGKKREILLEETLVIDGVEYRAGFTKEYVKAAVPVVFGDKGQMLEGRLTKFLSDEILLVELEE